MTIINVNQKNKKYFNNWIVILNKVKQFTYVSQCKAQWRTQGKG